jgi:hypothetical protein
MILSTSVLLAARVPARTAGVTRRDGGINRAEFSVRARLFCVRPNVYVKPDVGRPDARLV